MQVPNSTSTANPFEPEVDQQVADELQGGADESRSFTLPSIVDIDVQDKMVIHLFAEGCLSCGHLIPDGNEEDYPKQSRCHFTAGNDHCPAKFISMVATGHLRQAAAKIAKARADGDSAKLISLIGKLDKLTETERNFVMNHSGLI